MNASSAGFGNTERKKKTNWERAKDLTIAILPIGLALIDHSKNTIRIKRCFKINEKLAHLIKQRENVTILMR